MKKSGFIFGVLVFMLLTVSFVSADVGTAQTCLRDKIDEKTCAKLTSEEKAFSFLIDSKCKEELLADSRENECWPGTFCKTKTTAQAILALSDKGIDTEKATAWLSAQTIPTSELEWYLQIDSSKPTTCQITYDSQTHSTIIGEDSKLKSPAGTCLSLSTDNTWLRVKSSCFGKKFEIKCDETFSTSLLYQKKASPIIYFSGESNSASAQGTTEETVKSECFKSEETFCDYEATLWAALALKQTGKFVTAYLPYLNSMADENEIYLPESFLYKLTQGKGFYEDLSDKQQATGYWENSGNKFYDTAVALYSMQSETTPEKTIATSWLLSVQDSDGCWSGIRETAFLLHAGWGKTSTPVTPAENQTLESCDDLGGKECDYGETCDREEEYSSDGYCCLGKCEQDSSDSGSTTTTTTDEEKDYLPLIITLGILIVLVIIGIIFKDKLRIFWFRLKSKFSKEDSSGASPSNSSPPGFLPPGTPQQFTRPTRRIIPSQYKSRPRKRIQRKPKSGTEKEFSDVLKKLKDMGN